MGVIRREIPAWYFKITAYADELLSGLDEIDWPEKIKSMQRNWIGRSEGFEIDFSTDVSQAEMNGEFIRDLTVFTTRPDTLFGATFFLLAPEHPAVESITTETQRAEVDSYWAHAAQQSEVERMVESGDKTGVFTGAYVINPVNGERLPVWIADFVLPGYGSGAVMGVPAHDQRDYEFAKKFGLPVRRVISRDSEPGERQEAISAAYEGDGFLINSGAFTGLPNQVAIGKIADYLEQKQIGRRSVSYHMRDWLISRQRYWGTPIPILYCQQCGEVPVPEEQLPVLLPEMVDFQPDGSGRSPLASVAEFVNTTCPKCAGPARRETDTMGGFACSSWYFLRFTSPRCPDGPFEPAAMRYWMPVDLYVGGAEHAVLHLLYARFWTKVMADAGLVPFREPFTRLMNQGQMLGPDSQRMSKSRGNVITPDSIVDSYGADALRVYELFMAPFDQDVEWSTEGLRGAWRFLNRMWNIYKDTYHQSSSAKDKDPKLEHRLHQTIRQVTQRIQDFRINTLISTFMEFQNELLERQRSNRWRTATFHQALRTLLVLMAPVAPHISEELWHRTGHTDSVHRQSWPSFDPELASEDLVQLAVQVNGRLREVVEIPVGTEKDGAISLAFSQARVRQHIAEGDVTNIIYVPGKVLNIVTRK